MIVVMIWQIAGVMNIVCAMFVRLQWGFGGDVVVRAHAGLDVRSGAWTTIGFSPEESTLRYLNI